MVILIGIIVVNIANGSDNLNNIIDFLIITDIINVFDLEVVTMISLGIMAMILGLLLGLLI
jgi:hypothetical protein